MEGRPNSGHYRRPKSRSTDSRVFKTTNTSSWLYWRRIRNRKSRSSLSMDCGPHRRYQVFYTGVPLFGTLIALYKKGVPLVSLISLPALNSVLWASKGAGTYLDGQRVQLSTQHQLQDALVLSGTINTIENLGYGEAFKKIRTQARLYRGWGDCYGYYLAASGRADLMFDPVVSLWDIAPLPLLFQEAGGVFSTLSGEKELFDSEGKPVHSIYEGYTALAGSTLVQQKALSYFNL